MDRAAGTERSGGKPNLKKKKKKGVTRVAHAATLQLNPAKYGHTQNGKGVV
jgi:hypothetical protein